MRKTHPQTSVGVGGQKTSDAVFSRNHFAGTAGYSAEVQSQITGWGLTRVAGNVYECPSTQDFWMVKDGKIRKLVGSEVNNGESIPAAPNDKPDMFLASILDDLSF